MNDDIGDNSNRGDNGANGAHVGTSFDPEITEVELASFLAAVSTDITPEQVQVMECPVSVFPEQEAVMALHWHPQYVPVDLVMKRVDRMFPQRRSELIIPTQHNVLTAHNGYVGVEFDCYSPQFDTKAQLLLHFREEAIRDATVLHEMIEHTFRYRAIQLIGLCNTIQMPDRLSRLGPAAIGIADDEDLVALVRVQTAKLLRLIDEYRGRISEEVIQNRLIKDYFHGLKGVYGERTMKRAQALVKVFKWMVKAEFDPDYYYRTEEIIEETRLHGGGVIVPHPENFWPILLAEYDVDGYEVWNPQSHRYTDFLIDVLNSQNKSPARAERPLLMFMGDDTHVGDKLKDYSVKVAKAVATGASWSLEESYDRKSEDKVHREVGYQPAWDDLNVLKRLIKADESRASVIREYKSRLD